MLKYVETWLLAGWVFGGLVAADPCVLAAEQVTTSPAVVSPIAYDGWVHVQARRLDSAQPKDPDDPEDPNAKPPELYLHQAKGLVCTIMDFGDRRVIRLRCVPTGHMAEYDSKFGGLAFGTMDPELIAKTRNEIARYPLTLDAYRDFLKQAGAIVLGSNETVEDGYRKIVVAYVGGKSCTTCPDDGGSDVLWINPKTNRVRKLRTQMEHPQEITFTYDRKERKDLYDFGAPRDARILDSRPTPEAARILNRFDRHNLDGLGDFVGVLTETDYRKQWGMRKMFLYLYGQEGGKMFYAVYGLNSRDYPDSPMLTLRGWPKVDLRETLVLARKTIPLMYYATDGTSAWLGRFDTDKANPSRMLEDRQLLKDFPPFPDYFVIHHFWRNREALFLYGYGPKADILTDKDRPGLTGLRLREGDYAPGARNTVREERVFWGDPQRNDLPIQTLHCGERIADRLSSRTRFDTRFLDCSRLANGTWYPIHWKTEATREDLLAKTKDGYDREFHLQVVPGLRLEKTWYASWTKAMGIDAPKMNLKKQGGR